MAVTDNFNRTSTTSPGTTQTGQTWTAVQGTWGTDGARLYNVNQSDGSIVTINTGTVDMWGRITLAVMTGATFPRIWISYTGAFAGYWIETQSNGSAVLNRGFTTLGNIPSGTVTAGSVIEWWRREVGGNTQLTVWVDGVQRIDYTDTTAGRPSATVMGLRHGASGTADIRWDDLSIDTAPPSAGTPAGTAAGSWQFTGAAEGTTARGGTAAGTWVFAGAAAGSTTRSGTATGTNTWTGAATGTAPAVGQSSGTASGTWTYAGLAVGTSTRSGTATGTLLWAATATGIAPTIGAKTGTATGTWAYVGTAIGSRRPAGVATGTWTLTGTAAGTAPTGTPPRVTTGHVYATTTTDGTSLATLAPHVGAATLQTT